MGQVHRLLAGHKRFGIKFFKLCESSTRYIRNIFVFAGSDTIGL